MTARGVCWSTLQDPTVSGNHTSNGSGTGSFTSSITGLTAGTTYYVRAYATNSAGTAYGEQRTFTTLSTPMVTTNIVSNITVTSATCGGNVTSEGGASVIARGVCWSTSQNPTVSGNHTTDGSGTGSFTSSITGLAANTTYYVRAYATNSAGTTYGEQRNFTTLLTTPTVTTNTVSNITATTAICGGNVTSSGGASVTARGVCWSTSQNPTVSDSHTTDGTGAGSFTSSITGLTAGTTYYVRAYATNSAGTAYGSQRSFTTSATTPTVTTNSITNITSTSASGGGNVTATGGASVTARGVCWSTSQNPTVNGSHTTNGNGSGSFTSTLTGLTIGTTYYVRAYATNSVGTAYGNQVSFTALNCPSTVTDYDNNTYNTVQIGQQCWMRENLRTTHYSDGTSIALGSSISYTTACRYYPNNNSSNVSTYGYLYNCIAVMHGSPSSSANPSDMQGICPVGWHVPSDAEWTQLTNYVSSQSQYVCGSINYYIAKALASTTGWAASTGTCSVGNTPANNNATGFSALPAGGYYSGGSDLFGERAYYWSATQSSGGFASYRYRGLDNSAASVYVSSNSESIGYSVRCLGDGSSDYLPTVTTNTVTNITATTATSGGNVVNDGGAAVTARGVCWSTSQNPTVANSHTTDGSGTGSFTSSITGLSAGTTYYVRAYATNSAGTAYGNQMNFTTSSPSSLDGQPCPGAATVSDYDGHTYNTVQIGQQCWMKQNLRTTHYANGISIPNGVGNTSYTSPYYYNNSSSNIALTSRGYLYNWPAAVHGAASSTANPSGVQGICPTGWHLPSDAEWTQLTNYVRSQSEYICGSNSGNIAKALASTSGWWTNSSSTCAVGYNQASNNTTGFAAIPAGRTELSFFEEGSYAHIWSSTENNSGSAFSRSLYCDHSGVTKYSWGKSDGLSVRCLKD